MTVQSRITKTLTGIAYDEVGRVACEPQTSTVTIPDTAGPAGQTPNGGARVDVDENSNTFSVILTAADNATDPANLTFEFDGRDGNPGGLFAIVTEGGQHTLVLADTMHIGDFEMLANHVHTVQIATLSKKLALTYKDVFIVSALWAVSFRPQFEHEG